MFEYIPTPQEVQMLDTLWREQYHLRFRNMPQEQHHHMRHLVAEAVLNGMILERDMVRRKLEKCLTAA
jgi:hypothetical protein